MSTGKLTLLLAAVCAVILVSSDDAKAIGYPFAPINLATVDQHELGQVLPGMLSGDAEQYVNSMIGLSLGGSEHVIITGQDSLVTRSNNDLGLVPGPATLALTGEGVTVTLRTQGTYDYLLAKYDGPNPVSQVWYVGDLTDTITIPASLGRYGFLSGWELFTAPAGVPDGGATVTLLVAALGALGMVRRYLAS